MTETTTVREWGHLPIGEGGVSDPTARRLAFRLLTAVRRGLPHRYRLGRDDLPLLRGKLDIPRQIARHLVRLDLLACNFDELSVDTPLNRVLKAAVVRRGSITRHAANARRLAELSARLEFVGESHDPLREPVALDRTNLAFHRLYAWSCLFLSGKWQSTTTGANAGVALLFPMNDLFETFVGRIMQSVLAPGSTQLQHTGRYAVVNGKRNDGLAAGRDRSQSGRDFVADRALVRRLDQAHEGLLDLCELAFGRFRIRVLDDPSGNRVKISCDQRVESDAVAHPLRAAAMVVRAAENAWSWFTNSERGVCMRARISSAREP